MNETAVIFAIIVVLCVVFVVDVMFAGNLEMTKFEAIDNLVGIIVSSILIVISNKFGMGQKRK